MNDISNILEQKLDRQNIRSMEDEMNAAREILQDYVLSAFSEIGS